MPLLIAALIAAAPAQAQEPDPLAAARAQFVAAYGAVPAEAPDQPAADGDALKAYPLYPYLQAARFSRRLAALPPVVPPSTAPVTSAVDADIAAFLAALGDQPVTRSLRREWQSSLAARQAWPEYLAQYDPGRDGDNVALLCQSFDARIALERTDGLAEAVAATWLAPKALPEACEPAFAWLRARNGLGNDLVERRARLALGAGEASLARLLARSLPEDSAAPLLQWAALIEQPRSSIEALIATPDRPAEAGALLDGWERFARADAEAATAAYPALIAARKLDGRNASPYARAVALSRSWSRLPGALDWFAQVHPDDFDERTLEWRVRAALWAGDWSQVRAAIAAMPEALRGQNRWRYWSARAAQQLGDEAGARQGYAKLLPTDNWYALLAAGRLERAATPNPQPLPLSEPGIAQAGADPGLVRSHELLLCGLGTEASAEWRAAYDSLPQSQQVQAIGLASRWGWHSQAISAAARQGLFNDYDVLYPRPYDRLVSKAAGANGLPDALIYAVIRQESLYRADAASRAGAIGLMQLLPETARRSANRAGLPAPSRTSLVLPEVNIPLGANYLKHLVDRADGQVALAVAAYNAGPGAVRRWLPGAPKDLDVWVENIPYNETRGYVQRVTWHELVFAWLTDRKARAVNQWLGTVQAPADFNQAQ